MSHAFASEPNVTNPYGVSPRRNSSVSSSASLQAVELFDGRHVAIASFFGMPLAGATLLASNANQLGRKGQALALFGLGLAASILLLAAGVATGDYLPSGLGILIGLGYASGMKVVTEKLFADELKLAARPRAAHWRAVGVGILSIATLIIGLSVVVTAAMG